MKKLLLLILIIYSFGIHAQNISGQAYYQSKTTVDLDAFGGNRQLTEEMKKNDCRAYEKYARKNIYPHLQQGRIHL
jgi:hypothetical protein